ncbi:MAG: ThiF family adenylyltransferase, partial [Thiotrichaceae bacterium]|nr:ThiF family adenylyltransferase [Thiotrichaceae bacterium]
ADHDTVELDNLQRQIAHDEQGIGHSKVSSCYERMHKINSHIIINQINAQLSGEQLASQVAAADIVLDCTDNLTTRFAINWACVSHKKWLVSAAAIRWEGQISVYHCGYEDSPCYHCFYGDAKDLKQNCSSNGVLSPVVGVLGSMQAIEVIKLIINKGDSLMGRVLLFDAFSMQWESMQLRKNLNCSVCGNQSAHE